MGDWSRVNERMMMYEQMKDLQCPPNDAGGETCCWHLYIDRVCQMAHCCWCGIRRPAIGVHEHNKERGHGRVTIPSGIQDVGHYVNEKEYD